MLLTVIFIISTFLSPVCRLCMRACLSVCVCVSTITHAHASALGQVHTIAAGCVCVCESNNLNKYFVHCHLGYSVLFVVAFFCFFVFFFCINYSRGKETETESLESCSAVLESVHLRQERKKQSAVRYQQAFLELTKIKTLTLFSSFVATLCDRPRATHMTIKKGTT